MQPLACASLQLLARGQDEDFLLWCTRSSRASQCSMRQLTLTPLSPAAAPIGPSSRAFLLGGAVDGPGLQVRQITTHAVQWYKYTTAHGVCCTVLALDSTHTIVTLLRVGSDLQLDSLSSSATFPATHSHVARRGVPCIQRRFLLHTLCDSSIPPRCVTAGFFLSYFARVSREACCNPAIIHLLL